LNSVTYEGPFFICTSGLLEGVQISNYVKVIPQGALNYPLILFPMGQFLDQSSAYPLLQEVTCDVQA
jgi:hypothetical protein